MHLLEVEGVIRVGVRVWVNLHQKGFTELQRDGLRTKREPTRLHRGGPRTRGGGSCQFQGTVHTVELYRPPQYQTPPFQINVSVNKLFIILFHCGPFNLLCILLLN